MNDQMTHRIVCVTKDGVTPHRHVVAVGIETASHRWSVSQIRSEIAQGIRVVMPSATLRKDVDVQPFDCSCGTATIRSFIASSDPDVDELEDFANCPPVGVR
jgi:hypothetical protein